MHIKAAGEHLGKESDTKCVLQGRTGKNLVWLLSSGSSKPILSVQRLSTNWQGVSATETGTSLSKLQSVNKELAGCW